MFALPRDSNSTIVCVVPPICAGTFPLGHIRSDWNYRMRPMRGLVLRFTEGDDFRNR